MTTTKSQVLLSWSSGKESAWALYVLRQQPDLEVVGLLTTFNEEFDWVAMHAVRRELVEAQAAAARKAEHRIQFDGSTRTTTAFCEVR
jgi:diphthamide synthase (EF-2-diphthine--ammonia ligase)